MSFNHLQEGYIYYLNSMDNTIKNPFIDQQNSENSIDNINNISMPNDELLAIQEKERKRQNSLNNLKPFRPYSELTPEEQEKQKEYLSKGGKARAEQINKRKTMKESAQVLLSAKVSKEYAMKVMGENYDVTGIETMQDLITARMILETLENGNAKAFELIRDTSGNKPTAEIDIRADVVTAADRALMDKVADRLGLVDITDDDETD